jgi:hypothetical protein
MTRIEELKRQLAEKRGQQTNNNKEQWAVKAERAVRTSVINYRQQRLSMLLELEALK